jgi:RNA polymerase sigma-70 factor (ECF subfamily)
MSCSRPGGRLAYGVRIAVWPTRTLEAMTDPTERRACLVAADRPALPAMRADRAPGGSRSWVADLRGPAPRRDEAMAELHALLVRAARFELLRRRAAFGDRFADELGDLATQAADDALAAILAKLDTFRGASRFTTWAYKFVLLEASVRARRRAWQDREIPLDAGDGPALRAQGPTAHDVVERGELLAALGDLIRTALTPHQREVFCALALNEVPIDVLAERLGTTRGALYKTLHDARRKLRAALADRGFAVERTAPLRRPT